MTTYSDAVTRARAAYAVGMNKKAEEDVDTSKMTPEQQQYIAEKNGIVNRAKGEAEARRIAAGLPTPEEQNAIAADYIGKMDGVVNRAKGEEESRQRTAANDYLQNQVPQNIFDAQVLKKIQLGIPLSPEEQQRGLELQSQITAQTADENQKGIDATVASNTAKRNLGIGIGAGLAGGAAVGAGAYGLAGLFPSLRKRRLLRALMALTAGGAAGAGIGYGVTKGLNSGKIG